MDTAYLDRALDDLQQHKTEWARLPIPDKIEYLGRLRENIGRVARRWVAAACEAQGFTLESPWSGEEWTSGPYALAEGINAYEDTMRMLARDRRPMENVPVSTRPNGQVVADVFPDTVQDRLFLSGHTAETWMMPEVTLEALDDTVAVFYSEPEPEGAVALILGAGNIASIPPLDLLDQLLVKGQVAIVKLNPVNDYLGGFFEEIFAPMIDAGWVRFAYGGVDVGTYLTYDERVEAIHITGSAVTHNAIVFGSGPEGRQRRKNDEPILKKPITSELGGVSPTIVVPGRWSNADIRYQAEHLVTQRLHNNGFNCVASQVFVFPAGWPGAARLMDAIRGVIDELPTRVPYYPGTEQRMNDVLAAYPSAELRPWGDQSVLIITELDPNTSQFAFDNEFFGPGIATTTLPGSGIPEFLANATAFANHSLAGWLPVNIIVDPATARREATVLDAAIESLEYGTIAVNSWVGHAYGLPRIPWGGFPGATLRNIESGIGFVHNGLMFDKAQRTVVRGPFAPFPRSLRKGERHMEPKPPTYLTNSNAAQIGERLTKQAVSRQWLDMPGVFTSALRG